ncbi:VLRF1 family aeRF1-type release factor [Nonomuraea zeae]|uniref:VLRF1 family aeRF1-type release factor n=1 Tax=Nonomuraea zeae TaxID=1642303 RepID=UPI001478F011|nr:VLRF1 family aeRF1-type release factor [Nonomuraea zeae]
MEYDQTFLRDLVSMKDEVGVVSLYTTADPTEEASARPAWGIRLRNELSAIREQVASWPDRDRRTAVLSRLEELEPDIRDLVDAAESGIGRALFAAVSDGELRKISLQVPIQDCAVLESTAYVRPLVTAMATSAPAGLVLVSRDGVRLIDYRYGAAEDVARIAFDLDTEDWRQMRGPGPGGTTQTDSTQVDRYQRRIDDHLRRFMIGAAPKVGRRVAALSWTDVLLIGDPALTEILAGAMHPTQVVQVDAIVDTLSAVEAAKHVAAELSAARERRDAALVARVQDAALSGGKGVLGLNQTLALLNEGRVDHLLLDENGRWTGARGADGFLYDDQTPQSMVVEQEPDLGERMIEAALDNGARLTILGTEAARPLAAHKGVAALLRW